MVFSIFTGFYLVVGRGEFYFGDEEADWNGPFQSGQARKQRRSPITSGVATPATAPLYKKKRKENENKNRKQKKKETPARHPGTMLSISSISSIRDTFQGTWNKRFLSFTEFFFTVFFFWKTEFLFKLIDLGSNWFSSMSLGVYWVLPSFTEFYYDSYQFVLHQKENCGTIEYFGCTEQSERDNWNLPSFTGFYRV